MISPAVLTIGATASSNTIQGNTTLPQNVIVGTNGSANSLSIRGEGRFYDTASPYTSYAKISTTGTEVIYESPTGTSTTHIFKCYNALSNLSSSRFEINSNSVVSPIPISLANRLNHTATSYTFPFASSQSLGYYLKTTGTPQSVTTATPTSIVTTPSIPIGVWRIDFDVQNVVGATGAGTIGSAQSFITATLNGAVATAVDFTGSVVRSHVAEVYANNDVQVITSSFTYNQSTAGVLYLNIVRSFSTGTYSFTGEVAVTRLA
jgi:hypothetical protein